MVQGKNILITGGTGSLGQALTRKFLDLNAKTIRIFSRDENKQVTMEENFQDDRLRFLIGDVRDRERLKFAINDIDIVIHAAALKHVPVAEYNPFEFVKTNINGSQNIIDVSMDEEVELCLAISTDKAVSPLNLYGATKLAMEKLFIAANHYKGARKTKFSCVRYGNVFGSRGSVIPKFIEQIKTKKEITVTDHNMTRFNITMDDALDLILNAIKHSNGSEVFIPKLNSYKLDDVIEAMKDIFNSDFKITKIPIRTGEKTHELLLNKFETEYSIESNGVYVLLPANPIESNYIKKFHPNSKELDIDEYTSDKVPLLSKDQIKKLLLNSKLLD